MAPVSVSAIPKLAINARPSFEITNLFWKKLHEAMKGKVYEIHVLL
jgi:hypothetical protein